MIQICTLNKKSVVSIKYQATTFITELGTDHLISRGGGLGFFLGTSYFFLCFCTTSYFFQKQTATSFLFFGKKNTLKSEKCKRK